MSGTADQGAPDAAPEPFQTTGYVIPGGVKDSFGEQSEPFATTTGEVQSANFLSTLFSTPEVRIARDTAEGYANGIPPYLGEGMPPPPMPENVQLLQPADLQKQFPGGKFTAPMSVDAAKDIYEHQQAEAQRQDVIARRGDSILTGGAARFAVSAVAGMLSPTNDVAAFVPVLPEARVAGWLAARGDSVFGRAAVRAGVGALQGAAGQAALEPLQYVLDKTEGEDWTANEMFQRILMGAAIGGVMHSGLGLISDKLSPDDHATIAKTAVGQVLQDEPVQIQPLVAMAEARTAADALERGEVSPSDLLSTLTEAPPDPYKPSDFSGPGPYPVGREGAAPPEDKDLPPHGLYLSINGEGYPSRERQNYEAAPANPLRVDAPASRQLRWSAGTEAARRLLGDEETDRILGMSQGEAEAEAAKHGIELPDHMYGPQRLAEIMGARAAKEAGYDAIILNGKTSHGEPPELVALDKSILRATSSAPLETAGSNGEPPAVPPSEMPPVPAGSVRMYSSASMEANGERWATPDFAYARDWHGGGLPVDYVDVPAGHDALVETSGFQPGDENDGMSPTYGASVLPPDVVKDFKPVQGTPPAASDLATQRAKAETAAKDVVRQAQAPVQDNRLVTAEQQNATAVQRAPRIDADVEKQLAEATKEVQDLQRMTQREIDAGRLPEQPAELTAADEAAANEISYGKAADAAAACMALKGF